MVEPKTNAVLTWKALQAIPAGATQSFQICLQENEYFFAEEILRVLPKRRIVAAGIWRDQAVVAKIFFDLHRAKRHMEKEYAGVNVLRNNKIPTPPLLYYGMTTDKYVYIMIFQRMPANNLYDFWLAQKNTKHSVKPLHAAITELATQHVLGVLQHDLHLSNFLLAKKRIYTLDGAQIKYFPHKLSKKMSLDNLALLLSQLGIGRESLQKQLFQHYAAARGWLLRQSDYIEFFFINKKMERTPLATICCKDFSK